MMLSQGYLWLKGLTSKMSVLLTSCADESICKEEARRMQIDRLIDKRDIYSRTDKGGEQG